MQRRLNDILPDRAWPEGIYLDLFANSMAREAHALLESAYASGGGQVPGFENWWAALSQDAEYASDLCFPLRDQNGNLVAFAQCWTSAFVKDFAIHPARQRRGIGRSLLLHIFHIFQARGAETISLKVEVDNLRGVALYRSLGMSPDKTRC
jgi:ribosomal protein S18 acetylase RimI-like enzyme